jgi:probable F420-dependent oxidoreductase
VPTVRFAAGIAGSSDWPTIRAACLAAEAGGFDGFTRPDHLLAEGVLGPPGAPVLECFTTLAALVPLTSRLRFVQTVTCSSFRSPALLAKMLATLDVVSGGRVDLGIGAGWLRAEYDAYGYPFPPASVRLAQLREAIQVVKRLWTGEPVDFDGRHFRLRGAICRPRPVQQPRPSILVGGGGEGLLRVAAAEADVVNVVPPTGHGGSDPDAVRAFTLEGFRDKAARIRALADRHVGLSAIFFVQLADTATEAARLVDATAQRYGMSRAGAERFPLMLIGTVDRLREMLAERIALLDLELVLLQFPAAGPLARFAAEVLPAVRTG